MLIHSNYTCEPSLVSVWFYMSTSSVVAWWLHCKSVYLNNVLGNCEIFICVLFCHLSVWTFPETDFRKSDIHKIFLTNVSFHNNSAVNKNAPKIDLWYFLWNLVNCYKVWHLLSWINSSQNDVSNLILLHLNSVSTLFCYFLNLCCRCERLYNQSNAFFTFCILHGIILKQL